ncbi:CHAP domain-containing protein [Nocardia huaxiensis]|uniref:CHAP domain-containing protein n=1 Tax=Nocardia huaxiensis TaxID=2755382 RepID=A0A7D6VDU4_9NOCA|nr:CHAP domain-containing protein [Nocardia huaxiensis]QLY32753.1 CHAP domain-containing protein [Nocardia huaxiensis]UFS93511.1 CHAP domain-containing protein [Nocardia huaxiensis]
MTEQLAQRPPTPRRGKRWIAVAAVVLAVLGVAGGAGVWWWQEHGRLWPLAGERLREFPEIDRTGLDATQVRIIDVLEQEYAQQHPGTKYSEGIDEPWCADFVSWVMREAGQPLANPNSGSWRIPGVYTLEEFYREQNRFAGMDSGYVPRVGDVIMYADSSPFNQHTNIIVAVDGRSVTTVGGNEFGKITIHEYVPADTHGLVGYGKL